MNPTLTNHPPSSLFRRIAGVSLFLTGLFAFSAAGFAAAPAAGTIIGNQASADYTDSGGTPRTATSNVVQTIVQPVYSHTLVTNRTATAAPGGQVTYAHTLTNTGNATDSYTLSAADVVGTDSTNYGAITIYADADQNGVADNGTPLTGSISLTAGQSFGYVVVATIPGAAVSGNTIALTTSAVSTNSGTQTNTDTATITNNGVIVVTKAVSSASGPSPSASNLTYTLSYTNTGNTAATDLTITDVIPTGMTYVAGSARWSVTGSTVLTDANSADAQGSGPTITYDFNITATNRVTAKVSTVNPGESRTVTFQVSVNSSVAPGAINNTANYTYDPDGAGTDPVTTSTPTNTVPYTVTQTVALEFGNIASNGNFQGETVAPDGTVASAAPGATFGWPGAATTVKNFGNGSDSFDITVDSNDFPAGTTFALYKSDGVTPLIDTNGNSTPDTGTLAAGGTYAVVVKATLPTGATGGPYNVTLKATSVTDNTKTNTVINKLTAVSALTVDLTNDVSASTAGTQLGEGAGPEASAVVTNTTTPGVTTRFTLVAYNPNQSADSFDLAASTVANFSSLSLPSGWTVIFKNTSEGVITSTGTIPANSSVTYYADVTAPAGTAPGTTDLYFRVMSPATSVKDTIHDAVTISTIRSLVLTPNNTGQGAPGGTVTYEHTLTNNGNVTEGNAAGSSVALGLANNLAGWSSVVYYDANNNGTLDGTDPVVTDLTFVSNGTAGLAPLESVRLFVKVSIPGSAASPQSNVTTLTATTTNGTYTSTVPAVATVTDTTSVVQGNLELVKTQALDAACDGTADGAFASTQITTGAIPGACVRYQIVVKNVGSLAATGVKVYDSTPNATTYTNTVAAAVSGGTINTIDVSPANGATGSFTFNVGDLAPGASATITFGVKIDQ